MTDPALPAAEPLRFYRSFTAGPDFPGKLAATSFRYLLVSPVGLVRVVVVAIAFPLSAYFATVHTNGPAYALAIAGYGLGGFLVLIALITGIGFLAERRRFTDRIPPGSEFAVGFRAESLLMKSPMDTAEVAFTKFQTVEETGGFVVLRQRSSRILNFLPAECFTPESLDFLREQIGSPSTKSPSPPHT